MANTDARVDMTEGTVLPRLFGLAWPLVLGNLLQTLYNLADLFWVGRVSPEAVAAVSLMFPLSWMFVSTAMGLTAATIALVSQHVGAGEDRQADQVVGQTTILAIGVSVVLAAVGLLARRPLLHWIGAEGVVFTESLAYIEVIFLTLPLTFLFFAFRASLQGAGDTKTAMWLVAASAGVNIVIDPVFVLGWGPVPAMGTRGAAVATFISRALATGAGVYVLLKGDWGIQLHLRDLRPEPEVLRTLVDIGYPGTLDGWARSFAAVAMAALVARFGPAATAAYGVGVRLMSVSWTVAGAVGQATATGVGQNLGADTPDRASRVAWTGTGGTMGVLFLVGGVVWLFPATAIRVFVADVDVVAEGISFLRITAPAWAAFGGLMVLQGAFRGAGDTRTAMGLSLLSRWVFRIPAALVFAYSFTVVVPVIGPVSGLGLGPDGLWWAWTFGAVASLVVGALWFLRGKWTEGVIEDNEDKDDAGGRAGAVDGDGPATATGEDDGSTAVDD